MYPLFWSIFEPDNTFQTDVKTVTLFSLAVTAYRPPNNNNVKSGKSTRIKKKKKKGLDVWKNWVTQWTNEPLAKGL